MKMKLLVLALVASPIVLLGARCQPVGSSIPTTISRAVITTGVKANNEPENNLNQIAAGTNVIYLSVEVTKPYSKTAVQVSWYKIPNQILATENFRGNRGTGGGERFDFDTKLNNSWLAARATKPGTSWPLGEYKAEIRLNNRLAKTVFFTVVSDADADKAAANAVIKDISFGDAITGDNQLDGSSTSFSRDTANIYLQVATESPANTNLQISIRYLKEDKPFNTLNSIVSGNHTQLYTLSRSRFGKLWPDNLWPVGSFEVVAKVNGVVAKTTNFFVR